MMARPYARNYRIQQKNWWSTNLSRTNIFNCCHTNRVISDMIGIYDSPVVVADGLTLIWCQGIYINHDDVGWSSCFGSLHVMDMHSSSDIAWANESCKNVSTAAGRMAPVMVTRKNINIKVYPKMKIVVIYSCWWPSTDGAGTSSWTIYIRVPLQHGTTYHDIT